LYDQGIVLKNNGN
jgi:tetratricopeptide (TPR) repeat protein